MPLTTKSRDTRGVRGDGHKQAQSRTRTRQPLPGGRGRCHPSPRSALQAIQGQCGGYSGTNPCHQAGTFLNHLSGLAGEPAPPRRSSRQTNILKGSWQTRTTYYRSSRTHSPLRLFQEKKGEERHHQNKSMTLNYPSVKRGCESLGRIDRGGHEKQNSHLGSHSASWAIDHFSG